MEKLYTLAEAADMLNVNKETLRIWDRNGKLEAIKTPGGHRRYKIEMIRGFMEQPSLSKLYEHLGISYTMADKLGIEEAEQIKRVKESVGSKILKEIEG